MGWTQSRPAGDGGDEAYGGEEVARIVGVAALVTDQFPQASDARGQRGGGGDVGDVAAGPQDRARLALLVAERVDLGGAPAARAAGRLMACIAFVPSFSPGVTLAATQCN
jgi:hypothetical protein